MSAPRRRREGVKSTAGLVVEGDTEFKALPRLYTKSLVSGCPPLKAANLKGVGSDLSVEGIARRVLPKVLAHQAAGRRPILVCFDRESRDASAVTLASSVRHELGRLGAHSEDVAVCVADRAFEAWILADARGLHARKHFSRKPTISRFEGALGRENRKGVVELGELLGRPYAKTTDGPRLFEALDFKTARDHSAHGSRSLDTFLRALGV